MGKSLVGDFGFRTEVVLEETGTGSLPHTERVPVSQYCDRSQTRSTDLLDVSFDGTRTNRRPCLGQSPGSYVPEPWDVYPRGYHIGHGHTHSTSEVFCDYSESRTTSTDLGGSVATRITDSLVRLHHTPGSHLPDEDPTTSQAQWTDRGWTLTYVRGPELGRTRTCSRDRGVETPTSCAPLRSLPRVSPLEHRSDTSQRRVKTGGDDSFGGRSTVLSEMDGSGRTSVTRRRRGLLRREFRPQRWTVLGPDVTAHPCSRG